MRVGHSGFDIEYEYVKTNEKYNYCYNPIRIKFCSASINEHRMMEITIFLSQEMNLSTSSI